MFLSFYVEKVRSLYAVYRKLSKESPLQDKPRTTTRYVAISGTFLSVHENHVRRSVLHLDQGVEFPRALHEAGEHAVG